MILQAKIKLTLLYSTIFLVLFWILSFGIYAWMNQFYGDKIHIMQTYQNGHTGTAIPQKESQNDIVMDNLRNILLMIDFILLMTIPAITWFLTDNTLEPVQKAQKREQQFLTDASHELRTPLSILQVEMEVALKRKRTAFEYQHIIQSNKEEIYELISLVENLLFLSREQTKHSSPINEQIDITDVIAERVAFFQQKAKQKQLHITMNLPKTALTIQGNLQLLKRLITNLVDNAIKYTSKGNITITVTKVKETVLIQIADTGIGILNAHQEKIFDRFYRADKSRFTEGYGLGLSIAKEIVDAHKGTIAVESKINKGTLINLLFPLKH
ncbi:MAG TPA: HAMP domain-containing sensor histidine kinase [Candidatus Sulfotelmatobacter sp.]|jgi:signal transduction histidine kinase|nr:HAMP domain-containing sensor histidine kinase [Candidatus Sulfotelmatobacter sp.]